MPNKALIVNPYWDTLGGGERYVASLVLLLLDLGWQVDICWHKNLSSDLITRFGLDINRANWQNFSYTSGRSRNYDLLFWVSNGSLPVSFARKTLIHLQFPFKNVGGKKLQNLIKSRLYSFIVNSKFTKSFIDAEFLVNSHVVYPPVDTRSFSPGKKEKIILCSGRFSLLTQAKGQLTLISAFRNIYRHIPGWKLVLAGGVNVGVADELISELKRQARGLPVTIIFNPSFDQLKSLNAKASIFWSASGYGYDERVDPTRVEHFGITVVEAMAAGVVPIVTNLGGHKEIIDSGVNGFLWSDITELEHQTQKLISGSNFSDFSKKTHQKSKIFDITQFNDAFKSLINLK